MITKQLNGYIGYGETDEEAIQNCMVTNLMSNPDNISKFDILVSRFAKLAPWCPKEETLHIKQVGYIRAEGNYICVKETKVKVRGSLFETLYLAFYKKLGMLDLCICQVEICDFLRKNNLLIADLSIYNPIAYEYVDFSGDDTLRVFTMTSGYSFVVFDNNKVGIKANADDFYWTCSFDPELSSVVDALYYIAYFKGYDNIDKYIRSER